jgi:hypothetical protein
LGVGDRRGGREEAPRKQQSGERRSHNLDRLRVDFDAKGLVANAGLVLRATLADRLGLPELLRQRVRLGKVAGATNPDRKAMTMIGALLAGGEWMEDVNALRAGGLVAEVLGVSPAAVSTVGTMLRGSPLAMPTSWMRSRRISTGAPGRREPAPGSRC